MKLDLQKELSFEEIKHFFSYCGEFKVSKEDENGTIKIKLETVESIEYDKDLMKANYKFNYTSILVYKPTIQTLIRDIKNLGYLEHSNKEE